MTHAHGIRVELLSGSHSLGLLAAGDLCLQTQDWNDGKDAPSLFDPRLRELLADKTISIVNLECVTHQAASPIIKAGPCLMGHPRLTDVLRAAHFDIAGLANNHILDHGIPAMFATQAACTNAGLRTVGIGSNLNEASQPLPLQFEGIRLAIIALCEEEFSCAGEDRAGAARADAINAAKTIRAAAEENDIVIVFAHGGKEYYPLPTPDVQGLYRFMIDCGAHAVIGHHPHTIQGLEIYRNRPILYSLGNFLFPAPSHLPSCWNTGLVARLALSNQGVHSVELYPIRQHKTAGQAGVSLFNEEELPTFRQAYDKLSRPLSDPSLVRQCWCCYCRERKADYFESIKGRAHVFRAHPLGLLKTALRQFNPGQAVMAAAEVLGRWATPSARRDADRALVWNLLHCPTHHAAITDAIADELNQVPVSPTAQELYGELMQECRFK